MPSLQEHLHVGGPEGVEAEAHGGLCIRQSRISAKVARSLSSNEFLECDGGQEDCRRREEYDRGVDVRHDGTLNTELIARGGTYHFPNDGPGACFLVGAEEVLSENAAGVGRGPIVERDEMVLLVKWRASLPVTSFLPVQAWAEDPPRCAGA